MWLLVALVMMELYRNPAICLLPANAVLARSSLVGNGVFYPLSTSRDALVLLRHWETFRREALKAQDEFRSISGDLFFRGLAEEDGSWSRFYLKWDVLDPLARTACPDSCRILESLGDVRIAMFSVLRPGCVIKPHEGIYKGHLRFHLGLSCPDQRGCEMLIAGERYRWRDGEGVIFDDTYVHSVMNGTRTPRVVLFCDIVRPMGIAGRVVDAMCAKLAAPLTHRGNRSPTV